MIILTTTTKTDHTLYNIHMLDIHTHTISYNDDDEIRYITTTTIDNGQWSYKYKKGEELSDM